MAVEPVDPVKHSLSPSFKNADHMSEGGQTDIIIIDFTKAFNKVPYARLLDKLQLYGIHGSILSWISDFLSEYTQRVLVDVAASNYVAIMSGVPQVSVLRPILSLCYINDLLD